MPAPSTRSVIHTLAEACLLELGQSFSDAASPAATEDERIEALCAMRVRGR